MNRNQCDGCMQGAPVNASGNHVDDKGRPFMGCERVKYADPITEPKPPDLLTADERAMAEAIRETYSADYFEPLRRQARSEVDPHNTALAGIRLLAILDRIAPKPR